MPPMEIDVRVLLRDPSGRPFMGIGLVWLLQGIERHGSISNAARAMELSYPKALRMIADLERGLGQAVVLRHKGGSGRGGAELTPEGQSFLRRYDRLQGEIKDFALQAFAAAFGS